jgi:hypothetical protein
VHFYDIITAENVGAGIPLNFLINGYIFVNYQNIIKIEVVVVNLGWRFSTGEIVLRFFFEKYGTIKAYEKE